MSRPAKITYKTTNWRAYDQALRQRGSLTVWFDPSMHSGKPSCPADAAASKRTATRQFRPA